MMTVSNLARVLRKLKDAGLLLLDEPGAQNLAARLQQAEFRVASLDDIADGTAIRVDIGERPIALVRIGDRVHAIGDTCSHADYSLSQGDVEVADCTLECPRHGAAFSLLTGEPETLPAIQPVPVYATEVDGNDVWVVID